jgi:hypothetical protein
MCFESSATGHWRAAWNDGKILISKLHGIIVLRVVWIVVAGVD